MIDIIQKMLSYPFLQRALIVGGLVSFCAALLGVSLVLKRYSMIGDGLSHVGFGALAVATAMNAAPLSVSIPVVVVAAFMLLRISESSKIKGDAAIALISTASMAIGVIIISMTTGMNTDVCNYMFGSILSTTIEDAKLSVGLSLMVVVLFILFYHKIFAVTFDENFARATGTRAGLYNALIAFLTAITIVLGMRMMGTLLISSLIIFPSLTSMRLCKTFRSVIVSSSIVSLVCFFIGVVISYQKEWPTGASIVAVNLIAFLLFSAIAWIKAHGKQNKKQLQAASLVLVVAFLLGGCSSTETVKKEDLPDYDLEIAEKLFIAQTDDIYLNADQYFGKKIMYEGIFLSSQWVDTGESYYYVIRYGPGCCGYDGTAGFEIKYDGTYPEDNAWVQLVGTLNYYEENGYQWLYLEVEYLQELSERGEEIVLT